LDRFDIRGNIHHLRDELCSETDLAQRARLQKQLVEEEDRLGASAALLDDIEREIKKAIILIARQTALVVAMERGGGSANVKQARTLLCCLIDGQILHERYRQQVMAAIEGNKLL